MATESAQYLLKLLSLTSCTVSCDVTGHGVNTLETGAVGAHFKKILIFLIIELQLLCWS